MSPKQRQGIIIGAPALPSPECKLHRLREGIDAVDDGILDLILRRASMVRDVAEAKAEAGTLDRFLRPDREARILRRLAARNAGVFPPAALVRIWREMLCALFPLQGSLSVAIGGNGTDLWDTARDFYGSSSVMIRTTDGAAAARRVEEGTDQLAVVRADDHDLVGTLTDGGPEVPYIVSRLPFVAPAAGSGPRCDAFVLSGEPPQASGDDITVLAFSRDPAGAGLVARRHGDTWLAGIGGCHHGGSGRRIVRGGLTARVLGAYAAPLQPQQSGIP